jgi:hypothetical protein
MDVQDKEIPNVEKIPTDTIPTDKQQRTPQRPEQVVEDMLFLKGMLRLKDMLFLKGMLRLM